MSLVDFVPTPVLAEYKEVFKDHFVIDRTDDGIITVRGHTNGGPIQLSVQNHRALGQVFRTVGSDPNNEVMIFTGTGDEFMLQVDPTGFEIEESDLEYWAYEHAYKDGRQNSTALIHDIEVPTIGVMNGSGFHSELVLMCDITLCADDAVIFDPHFRMGSVPGDGIHSCFQELLGSKRAAYALYTGQGINAQQALEYGMVNEVLPRAKLMDRAHEIAAIIMQQPRSIRRLTTQIVRRPWKQRLHDNLDGGFGIQMFGHLAKGKAIHSSERAVALLEELGIRRPQEGKTWNAGSSST
jgi:enoyl-CoA hydratase/carnithine racemase